MQMHHSRRQAEAVSTYRPKGRAKITILLNTPSKPQMKKGNGKVKKDTWKWCELHKSPWHNTDECRAKQSLVAEMKSSKLDSESDSKTEPDKGKWIIDAVRKNIPPMIKRCSLLYKPADNGSITSLGRRQSSILITILCNSCKHRENYKMTVIRSGLHICRNFTSTLSTRGEAPIGLLIASIDLQLQH